MSEMDSQHLERGSVKKDPTNSYVESCPKLIEGERFAMFKCITHILTQKTQAHVHN